jgi:hypothetical protein
MPDLGHFERPSKQMGSFGRLDGPRGMMGAQEVGMVRGEAPKEGPGGVRVNREVLAFPFVGVTHLLGLS